MYWVMTFICVCNSGS